MTAWSAPKLLGSDPQISEAGAVANSRRSSVEIRSLPGWASGEAGFSGMPTF